jgi:hypothetical protein
VVDLLAEFEEEQTNPYRPDENATPRARLDSAHTRDSYDANGGKGSKDVTTETTANEGGSSARQSENNAAKLPAEAAGCPKAQDAAQLDSGIDFPIQIVKVSQPLHRQAVFVSFALEIHICQMPGQPFAGALGLGTVCKCAIDDQRAINR